MEFVPLTSNSSPMISKLYIENFRSIKKAELPLGKITVLTGANNSGKSSLLYGFFVLRDFVKNPNQSLEQLFTLPFISLGGFDEVICSKCKLDNPINSLIKIGIETTEKEGESQNYQIVLGEGSTTINSWSNGKYEHRASLAVGLPYVGNIERSFIGKTRFGEEYKYKWNGISSAFGSDPLFSNWIDYPVYQLYRSDFVPIKRGFTKPYYSKIPLTGENNTEEEIATLLATNDNGRADTLNAVNTWFEEITGKTLQVNSNGIPGVFSLSVEDLKTKQRNFLVNEGTGVNQLVTILAKTFQYNNSFMCIDEPEIHLHPSMIRKLADGIVEIVNEFGEEQFLISTHSEHFIQSLLMQVASGAISPENLKIYYLSKDEDGLTSIEHQPINEKGQIAGGLSHFYESELADLQSFFKLVD